MFPINLCCIFRYTETQSHISHRCKSYSVKNLSLENRLIPARMEDPFGAENSCELNILCCLAGRLASIIIDCLEKSVLTRFQHWNLFKTYFPWQPETFVLHPRDSISFNTLTKVTYFEVATTRHNFFFNFRVSFLLQSTIKKRITDSGVPSSFEMRISFPTRNNAKRIVREKKKAEKLQSI